MLISVPAVLGLAQQPAPPGVLAGELKAVTSNTIQVLTVGGQTYDCSFDNRTYMERDSQRIFGGALRVDDRVEIIADRNASSCYARTIRVVRVLPQANGRRPVLTRPYRALDNVFPRGNMTFAGVVRRVSPQVLVLRTRTEPEMFVLLREDTRYLENGAPAEFSRLTVNTRVFVRGGKNYEENLEAYQIVWGEISGPKRDD
jgi:hypothetical protein